jgi:DNA polymerase-3 subunit epsilon
MTYIPPTRTIDKLAAINWAKAKMSKNDWIILDTETNCFNINVAEVIEIAVIGSNKAILLNTLLNPSNPITNEATEVHGIKNDHVRLAPHFGRVSASNLV